MPHVLVVEDNPDNLKLFKWVLEDGGYDYTTTTTAEEMVTLSIRWYLLLFI